MSFPVLFTVQAIYTGFFTPPHAQKFAILAGCCATFIPLFKTYALEQLGLNVRHIAALKALGFVEEVRMWTHRLKGSEGNTLSPDAKVKWASNLERLAHFSGELHSQDFDSRFRGMLTRPLLSWRNRDMDAEQAHRQRELQGIVAEVLNDPALLEGQWPWMLQFPLEKQWLTWHFFEALGGLDHTQLFAAKILQIAVESPQAIMWHSMYQLSQAQAEATPDYIDEYLESLLRDHLPIPLIFDLLVRAGYSQRRMDMVMTMLRNKEMSPLAVASLKYQPWGESIPVDSVFTLVSEILSSANEPQIGISLVGFLFAYLQQNKEAIQALQSLSIEALSLDVAENSSDEWAWAELAGLHLSQEPLAISVAAIQQMRHGDVYLGGRFKEVVLKAWNIGDKQEIFSQAIAPVISFGEEGRYTTGAWTVQQAIQGFPLEEAGVDFLLAWVAQAPRPPQRRALALAEAMGAPSREVSDLHAALLEHYAEEGVGSSFDSAVLSGSWEGHMSDWMQEKINVATDWLKDERPAVRKWAEKVMQSLQLSFRSAQEREAEETLLRRF